METQIQSFEATIKFLQNEAVEFLTNSKLILKGVVIQPTEIEVYYFKEGEFEDKTVHKNELQQNNALHFYIHRRGKKATDSIKGGNRAGIDFVLSDEENKYYTYLIRSAIIKGALVNGPHNVLEAIKKECNSTEKDIEETGVQIVENKIPCEVLFSNRINLGKNADEFRDLKLRAVLCDDAYKQSKYPAKEQMIIDYIVDGNIAREQAMQFACKRLGYIPKKLRLL